MNAADEATMKTIVANADKAKTLGLATGEGSRYAELIEARRPSVAVDLHSNRPADGYDLATLQKYFNEIVETRHITQRSVNMVNAAHEAYAGGEGENSKAKVLKDFLAEYTASTNTIVKIGELLNVSTTGYKN